MEEKIERRDLYSFSLYWSSYLLRLCCYFGKKDPDIHCLEEDMNNAYKCYWSDPDLIPYLNVYGFLVNIFLYSVCPVILVVVLNSISAVAFLRRYFARKKKQESQRNVSGRQETAAGNAREDNDIHRKLSGVMFLLSLCSLIFVGSWYCLKIGVHLHLTYSYVTYGSLPNWYWQKVYEVSELVGHVTTSFNGIVNSLILLMFPVTRHSLKTFLRRLFGKTTE